MNSRRLIGSLNEGRSLPHRYRNAALCITAKLIVGWQRWVISGKAQNELITSAPPPKADMHELVRQVRFVPIVLQKSPRRGCRIEIRNNRIDAIGLLYQCCALAPNLKSILRARMRKIVLQHNLPQADICSAAKRPRHSITSSARRRMDVGNSMPIAFAVLRLITVSKFVTCSTGRSAGFAPRKTLAT